MNALSHCGYVAIIGRPNVGKSTLLNAMLGQKLCITSDKPQTTRDAILGIKTIDQDQIVFIDTPGIHASEGRAMNRYMNRLASSVIPDADLVLMMVEARRWTEEDELVLEQIQSAKAPVILILNKIDELKDKAEILAVIDRLKEKFTFSQIIPLSALKADNVLALEKEILKVIPEGPHLFPDDQITDKSLRFQIAELIREKLMQCTGQEVPYSTSVEIEAVETDEKLMKISAIIWVERDGQKAIIIGKQGEVLKRIGTYARKDIEGLIQQKVFLKLWVKVKDKWTDDERALKSLGYD